MTKAEQASDDGSCAVGYAWRSCVAAQPGLLLHHRMEQSVLVGGEMLQLDYGDTLAPAD